jgi:hypothetical protein
VSEQETDRLQRVVSRLMDAHSEAQEAARQGVGEDESSYEDSEMRRGHLEEALMDVLDILEGATEDVNAILRETDEERGSL